MTYDVSASAYVLAHPPVEAGSVTVKSSDGAVTYTPNVDYTVNLATGVISSVSGASMTFAEGGVIKVSYRGTKPMSGGNEFSPIGNN